MKSAYKAMPNIFSSKLMATTFALIALLFLASCGKSSETYCSSNFITGGVGMRVTHLVGSLNEFEFEVCFNDTSAGSQVSVYGVQFEGDIASINVATDVRLAHLTDGIRAGQKFSVTFNNNDAWFVIYKDDSFGSLDNSVEIIRGEFR